MQRKQFDVVVDKKLGKGKILQLTYTIVMIDKKVIRILNHSHTRSGLLAYFSISPTSETYLSLKRYYERLYSQESENNEATNDVLLKVI